MTTLRNRAHWMIMLSLAGAPGPASAQSAWTELSTIGYGGLGVGAGVLAIEGGLYAFDTKILLGAALGLALGHAIGSDGERAARRGEDLSPAQLWGVRVGTVAGGAAIGAGLAGLYVTSTAGNEPGEDERNILLSSVLGAVGGAILQYSIESRLGRGVPDGFGLSVSPGTDGAVTASLSWMH